MKLHLSIVVLVLLMGCQSTKEMGSTDKNKTGDQAAKEIEHYLGMYPEPGVELERHTIVLPKKENETDYKIELYAGKTMEVDCNKHTMAGEMAERTVSGWGYPYFEFSTSGLVMSTRMACPEDSLHKEFVQADSKLVRYNSKLPIVIYTPKGYEVKYRIWNRGSKEYSARFN